MKRIIDFVRVFFDALQMEMGIRDAFWFALTFRPIDSTIIFSEDGTRILNWDEIMEEASRK